MTHMRPGTTWEHLLNTVYPQIRRKKHRMKAEPSKELVEPTAKRDSDSTQSEATPPGLPAKYVPFFAAMRTLQSASRSLVGRDTRPAKEPVRLRAEAALSYPSTELARSTTDADGRVTLEVTFLGLFGPSGALPQHYTQTVIDRSRHKDYALKEFLDLFNHRWLSLFYRAWEKHDYAAAFQTSQSLGQEDTLTHILWCLIGLGTGGLRGRLRLEERSLLYYVGLLSDRRSRQSALANMLADWFRITVEVKQFQGQWIRLPPSDRSCVQRVTLGWNSNNRLGIDAVAGDRVWDVENRFRIRIGSLNAEEFNSFSPRGSRLPALHALTRTYVGPQLEFDVQVVVHRSEVPVIKLGSEDGCCSLGWNTWLGDWPFDHDADDAIFELDDASQFNGDPV